MTGATVFVPGRIEILGKHTDYAGGSSLLVATERGFTFRAEPLAGADIVLRADASGDEVRYRIHRNGGVVSIDPAPGGGKTRRPPWAIYGEAVLERLAAGPGEALRGARVTFDSDLPAAAGLSSSSALVTGLFLTLDAICGFSERADFRAAVPDRPALATWLAAVERGGSVGTRGGSEDHTAILLARAGRVVRYAFAPVRARGSAPLPAGWVLAVGASGVVAEKSGGARGDYNRLSDLAATAAGAWAAAADAGGGAPHLGAARAAAAGDDATFLDTVRAGAETLGLDPDPLVRRARHFLEETALVDAAFDALAADDPAAFAAAANRSADRGAALLGNQVPETLALTRLARDLGAPAASPFGAGFGGAVWALVPETDADGFVDAWKMRYHDRHPDRRNAHFFVTRAADPAGPYEHRSTRDLP